MAVFDTSVLRRFLFDPRRRLIIQPRNRAEFERQPRTLGIAEMNGLAAANVHGIHPPPPEKHSVPAVVVGRDPAAVEAAQQHVGPGDRRMRQTHVGPHIAPNHHIGTWRERALPTTESNGDRGRQRPAHRAVAAWKPLALARGGSAASPFRDLSVVAVTLRGCRVTDCFQPLSRRWPWQSIVAMPGLCGTWPSNSSCTGSPVAARLDITSSVLS